MILPNWTAPQNVTGFTQLCDDPPLRLASRRLNQVHGHTVIEFPSSLPDPISADAVITRTPSIVCSIHTADCLPILVSNLAGNEVAAIHAGWRGLVAGIIENTFSKMQSTPVHYMAWIGPAICGHCFEVGPEVRAAFIQKKPAFAHNFLKSSTQPDKYFGALPAIAESILKDLGVKAILQSQICTFEDVRCNSYRREHGTDQRMITGIFFE